MKVMENLVAENFFDRFKGRLSRRSYNKLIDEYNYAIENIKRYIELNIPFDKEIIEKVNQHDGYSYSINSRKTGLGYSNEDKTKYIRIIRNSFRWFHERI